MLAASFTAPGPAVGQASVRRVGIVVTHQVNVTAAQSRDLAVALGEGLAAELPIDVVSGRDVERLLPEQGLPADCVAVAECRQDLGRRLDADELLLLSIARVGSTTQIDSTWANVASGRVSTRPAIRLAAGDDPARAFTGAGSRLLPHVARREPPASEPKIVLVTPSGPATPQSTRRFTTGAWIASGVGAVALIAGGTLALSARNKWTDLDARGCRTMGCPVEEIDSLRRRALSADILFGTAAVSGVVAAILYWRSSGSPASADDRTAGPPYSIDRTAGPPYSGDRTAGPPYSIDRTAGPPYSIDRTTPAAAVNVTPSSLGVSVGGRF